MIKRLSIIMIFASILIGCHAGGNASDSVTTNANVKTNMLNNVVSQESNLISDISTNNWMSYLNDDMRLSQIVMPGSHDAGMGVISGCRGPDLMISPSKTQISGVYNQMLAGSRFFDIRVDYDNLGYGTAFDLYTYHMSVGFGCYGERLSSLLGNATVFLSENPQEFLLMRFNKISNSSIGRVLNLIKSFDSSYFYLKTSDSPTNPASIKLSDLRGKILIVFDEEQLAKVSDEEKTKFYALKGIKGKSTDKTLDDTKFNIDGGTEYGNSMDEQLKALQEYSKGLGSSLFYYISFHGYGTQNKIWRAQNEYNPLIPQMIKKIKELGTYPNIIHLDAIDATVTKPIIELNFRQKLGYFFNKNNQYTKSYITDEAKISLNKNKYNYTTSEMWHGISSDIAKKIQAVSAWEDNRLIYFFLNDGTYLRYNLAIESVDVAPRKVSQYFSRISDEQAKRITAVTKWNNGVAYFFFRDFKSRNDLVNSYLRYDMLADKVDQIEKPTRIAWGGRIASRVITGILKLNDRLAYFFFDDGAYLIYDMHDNGVISYANESEWSTMRDFGVSSSDMVGAIKLQDKQ